jgi:DNA repair exonuclease SbcCD nuclease subunit
VRYPFFSDAHTDHVTYGVPRRPEIAEAFRAVLDAAAREQSDAVFFLGDLCDPDDPCAVLDEMIGAMARELIAERRRLVCIPGNHCVREDGSGKSVLTPLQDDRAASYVHVFSRPVATFLPGIRASGFNVVALPFTPASHPYDPDAFVRGLEVPVPDAPTFVIGHLCIPGVQPGEETKELPRGREVVFPLEAVGELVRRVSAPIVVLNGHYHRRQDFVTPHGYTIHIPGAPCRLTMGEDRHEPAFILVEV